MMKDQDKTIYEQLAEAEKQEKERQKACQEAIKKIHAEGGYKIPYENLPRRGPAGAGNIAKFSSMGRLIGWYRNNQSSGMPSCLMPIQQELQEAYQTYKRAVISAFPQQVTASLMGRRSGQRRKEHGLSGQILSLQQALRVKGIKKCNQAHFIAEKLGCNVEYVRRVLRKSKPQNNLKKSTT